MTMRADLTPEMVKAQTVDERCSHEHRLFGACVDCIARALTEWGAERDAALRRANALVRGWRVSSLTTESSAGPSFLALADILDGASRLTPATVSERARREREARQRVIEAADAYASECARDGADSDRHWAARKDAKLRDLLEACFVLPALDTPPAGGA